MRYLVTGGAGFIGSNIVEALSGHEVVVLDDLSTGFRDNLRELSCTLVEGTIESADDCRRAVEGCEGVFHLAARISVSESMERPEDYVRTNTIGTLILLRQAAKAGVRRLVFSSSCAVYGSCPTQPWREEMLPAPLSPYAVTKRDGELYLGIFGEAWGVGTAALRYFNVFGPRQNPKSQYAAAIPAFATRAVTGKPLTVFGDGEQTRDFISVRDVVRANLLAMERGNGIYNVCTGRTLSVAELAAKIVKLSGSSSKIAHDPPRAGDIKHASGEDSRLRALGFAPEPDFDARLKETIDFFRAHPA